MCALVEAFGCESGRSADARAGGAATDSLVYAATIDSLARDLQRSRLTLLTESVVPTLLSGATIATEQQAVRQRTPTADTAMIRRLYAARPGRRTLREVLGSAPRLAWTDSATFRQYEATRPSGPSLPGDAIQLSPVAYAADERQAVVYVSLRCLGWCGRSEYVLVRRGDDRRWRVFAVIVTMVA